jgi:hypothetical protein
VLSINHSLACLALIGLAAPVPALAQTAHSAGSIQLPVPDTFADYRAFAETPVASWRDTNDRVREVGGWRAYARQVQAANARATDTQSPAPGGAVADRAGASAPPKPTPAQGATP